MGLQEGFKMAEWLADFDAEALRARGHRVAAAGDGLALAAPLPTTLP